MGRVPAAPAGRGGEGQHVRGVILAQKLAVQAAQFGIARDQAVERPPLGHFQKQWLDACRDTSLKTACDFEYSGNMIEQLLLGLVAYRVGKKLDYDGAAGRVTNSPEANELLRRKYRAGWTLDG